MNADRSNVERALGRLKNTCRRLKFLYMIRLDLVPSVIIAACCIHNFKIDIDGIGQDDVELRGEEGEEGDEDDFFHTPTHHRGSASFLPVAVSACATASTTSGRQGLSPLPQPLPQAFRAGSGNRARHQHRAKHHHEVVEDVPQVQAAEGGVAGQDQAPLALRAQPSSSTLC